jgi:arabinofuranan 3-O-arabinosyltransferase
VATALTEPLLGHPAFMFASSTDPASYPTVGVGILSILGFLALLVATAFVSRRLIARRRHRRHEEPIPSTTTSDTEEERRPVLRTAVTVGVIGFVIVLLGAPGRFVNDNRFIMFWNPGKGLGQLITVWDSQANLGTPSNLQGFLMFVFTSVVHSITASPWLTERALHGAFLAGGAVGVVLLTREFIPRSRLAPMVAGLWWIAAPYTAGFLIPSALYVNAALCPWLMLATLRAVTTSSRWRWSAVFALCVAISGFINPPALAHAFIPLIPLVIYLLVTRQTILSTVVGWAVRSGFLTLVVMLPWIARSALSAGTLADNLGLSETAYAVSLSSSWSETLRGLGGWLIYWNPNGPLQLTQMGILLDSTVVVLLSFVPIILAYTVVVRSSRRSRLLFGSIALLCAMTMVGAYPWASSSPFGRFLLTAYRAVPGAFALRNVYKAGGGLLVATCVLLGFAAQSLHRRLRDRPRMLAGVGGLFALTLLLCSSPLWTGAIYNQTRSNTGVPTYWTDAMNWLDEQPGADRAMVAPTALNEIYNWGSAPSGDLFASLMDRPYLLETLLKTGAVDSSNLVFALENDMSLGTYRPGTIGPIAHRLGIGYVVLRNDLDWRRTGSARPSRLASIRTDPALTLVAEFGEPGQNVTRSEDSSPDAAEERRLPPVQIYRVAGENEPVRAVAKGPALLLSGDGEAWPSLAINGTLDRLGPIRYTGRLTPVELTGELRDGASLIVTDTNRLRSVRSSLKSQATLNEFSTARTDDLFLVPGSQSVSTYPDAIDIQAIGRSQLVDPGPEHRPAAAFDNDPRTSWLVDAGLQLQGEGLQVELRKPTEVSSIQITTPLDPTIRQVESVRVDFSDGTTISATIDQHRATISFPARTITGLRVVITKVSGRSTAPFGITEISIPGVDLHETTRAPDDVFRAAETAPALADQLRSAPLAYSFTRLPGESGDLETALYRTFRVPSERSFRGTAAITFGANLTDRQLASILGTRIIATAFQNPDRPLDIAAPLSTDGNTSTAWEAAPLTRAGVSLTFPQQTVRSVELELDLMAGHSRPGTIEVSSGGRIIGTASVEAPTDCPATGACLRILRVPTTSVSTNELSVSMSDFSTSVVDGVDPTVRVVEITLDNTPNAYRGGDLPTDCHTDLAAMDRSPLGFSLSGTESQLLAADEVQAATCGTTVLTTGWHSFSSGTGAAFDTLFLSTTDGRSPVTAAALPVEVTRRGNSAITFTVTGDAGGAAITGEGFYPSWKATADGSALGPPVELDTQAGWFTTTSGTTTVAARFGPEGLYSLLMKQFLFGLVLIVALIAADPRTRRRIPRFRHAGWSRRWFLAADVGACAFAIAIAGLPGLVMAVAALVMMRRRILRASVLGWLAIGCLAAAAVTSVPPLGPSLVPLAPSWVANREFAHQIALISALLLAVTMAQAISDRAKRTETPRTDITPE